MYNCCVERFSSTNLNLYHFCLSLNRCILLSHSLLFLFPSSPLRKNLSICLTSQRYCGIFYTSIFIFIFLSWYKTI